MSNDAHECFCMSPGMLVNQFVTSDVFFHWFSFVVFLIFELMLFADFTELTFCGIYEAACGAVGEVIFVVF